jgi:hypothetical protein
MEEEQNGPVCFVRSKFAEKSGVKHVGKELYYILFLFHHVFCPSLLSCRPATYLLRFFLFSEFLSLFGSTFFVCHPIPV